MWLDALQLTDFRAFRHLELDLRRQLTVVIGSNGAGKSSLIEALEIAASHATHAVFRHCNALDLGEHDVRLGQASCAIALRFDGTEVRVRRTATGNTERDPERLPEGLFPPLVVIFKSNRALLKTPRPPAQPGMSVWARASVRSQFPAWDDGFGSDSTAFERGEAWFREREDLENQERVRSKRLDYLDPGLELARRSIEAALPRYRDPHIDRSLPIGPTSSQFVLSKDGQELTADMLSEGERSLLILTMTIARRVSLLGPTASSSSRHAAVVVIDEIELHLHPKWQRTILPALLAAFPSCQLIVTTHSPQVIGSIPHESLFVLEGFELYRAPAPTAGRDSNAILEEIMATPERSEPFQQRLDEIARLIDTGDLEAAKPAVDDLAARWGEDDREIVRLRTALEFRDL
jgi:energy-coupling factor transporter ATP-binding protein EcfA2